MAAPGVAVAGVQEARVEMVAVQIAGPETAARLGVPVGTPVDARHVRNGMAEGEDIVSVGEAQDLLREWGAE